MSRKTAGELPFNQERKKIEWLTEELKKEADEKKTLQIDISKTQKYKGLSMGVWEDSLSMLEAHGYRINYDPLKKTAKIMAV